jgi:dipeptidyl aminopeptidase/acylaminoacyl peptidase
MSKAHSGRLLLRAFRFALVLALPGCFTAETPPDPALPDIAPPGAAPAETELAHPLSIAYLRARTYEGSDFVLEQTLDPGSGYDRYVVSYRSDGLKIYALMTVPRGLRPPSGWPVVIFNHGYIPPDEYRTTERYVAYVDAFARSGYIVIKSDYRGHGSSEGSPASAYGSPAYTVDVLNAVAAARRFPDADPERIGLWGHSMGGYITLRAMVVDQGIRAGVIWAGVVASYDEMFRSWFGSRWRGRSNWLSDMVSQYGDAQSNPAFWASLSANSYLADLSGPVQIHHGTGDPTVPYGYSVLLDEQIRAVGGTSELLLFEGDDHNISVNRDGALAVSVVFMDRYVKECLPFCGTAHVIGQRAKLSFRTEGALAAQAAGFFRFASRKARISPQAS